MKKYLGVMMGLMVVSTAFASSKNEQVKIPADATILYQVSGGGIYTGTQNEVIAQVLDSIKSSESNIDPEFKCQNIYYYWAQDSSTRCEEESGWGPGGCINPFNVLFGGSHFVKDREVTVTAYCEARSYDQKVALSLERQCEATPTPECLDDKVKTAIASIQPTRRYNVGKR